MADSPPFPNPDEAARETLVKGYGAEQHHGIASAIDVDIYILLQDSLDTVTKSPRDLDWQFLFWISYISDEDFKNVVVLTDEH